MSDIKEILEHMDGLLEWSANGKATLRHPMTASAISLNAYVDSEFSKGVASAIFDLYILICNTPDGRKAASDLGFKPIFQDVESPTSGGSDD